MKKALLLVLSLIVLSNCKNDSKSEDTKNTESIDLDSPDRTSKQSDGLTLLKGEFVYYADAAVLQTHREIYAVINDEKMQELNDLAQQYKKEATDYVSIEIRGEITPKPVGEEGWDYRVAIKEILKVTPSNPEDNDVVKLESK